MPEAVFKAVYAEWKVIKTRSAVQLVFEIPIEKADEAYQVLGGMPIAANEQWCAIARLDYSRISTPSGSGAQPVPDKAPQPPARADGPRDADDGSASRARGRNGPDELDAPVFLDRRPFTSLPYSTRAAIRGNDPIFRAFLREMCSVTDNSPEGARAFYHRQCGVGSRKEILPGTPAAQLFDEVERWFEAWKVQDRVVA